jgi:hypothetical protein
MNQTNYKKLFSIFAFIVFAAVSCWATTESLHLLLSSWPKIMCWAVSIGFFVIASIGSKMIVDSLNQNIYMEKRTANLCLGILIMLIFWLVCSLPTNTHTFFYRTIIDNEVSSDISRTRGYLSQIKNNTNNKELAHKKIEDLKSKINILLAELEAEIKNELNPGFGAKSKEIFRKFAIELGVDKIEPLSYSGSSVQGLQRLCDEYRKKMYTLMDAKARDIESSILFPNSDNLDEAKLVDENLALVQDYISDGTIDLNKAEDIKDVCDKLNQGYNTVKKNQNFVNFSSESDKEKYTADSPITDVKRKISVFDVWMDFIKGAYSGHGFIFWILISILVDVAAFIFFDIAFKKQED